MCKTIGLVSIKGGVGKTTISASLASSLANHFGKKVLLVDANYSAPNLGLHMDIVEPDKTIHHALDNRVHMKSAIHNKFGVDVIPGNYIYNKRLNYFKLKYKLNILKKDYDFIVIDSSPSMNDEVLSTMFASDLLFLVTTPDYPTMSCTLKTAKMAKQRKIPIAGLIVNKVRDPSYELTLKELEHSTNIPVVARIPDDKSVGRSLFTRIPATIYKKRSGFSKEIGRLCSAITMEKRRNSIFRKLLPFNFRREEINRELLKEKFYHSIFEG